MDFEEDFILMGHDGPGHIAISDGKPMLRGLGLFHGKRGYGLSVVGMGSEVERRWW